MPNTNVKPQHKSLLPAGIEIFRTGLFTSDDGTEYNITDDILNEIASTYNPAFHEAPVVAGHVKHDRPAYGWVTKAYVNGAGRLLMDADKVDPQFAEMVEAGRFKKRSVSLYHPEHPANPTPGKWHLKHVAFLGAQPPAVKGLKDIEFSENGGCVCFSEALPLTPYQPKKEPVNMAENNQPAAPATTPTAQNNEAALQAQIADLQKQLQDKAAELEATQAQLKAAQEKIAVAEKEKEQQQVAEVAQFAESMVKEGRILPKDKAMEIAIMTELQKAKPAQFSEGNTTRTENKLDAYKAMVKARPKLVQFGEFAPSSATAENPDALNDDEIDKRVQAYMSTHPDVSYVDALNIVKLGQDKQA